MKWETVVPPALAIARREGSTRARIEALLKGLAAEPSLADHAVWQRVPPEVLEQHAASVSAWLTQGLGRLHDDAPAAGLVLLDLGAEPEVFAVSALEVVEAGPPDLREVVRGAMVKADSLVELVDWDCEEELLCRSIEELAGGLWEELAILGPKTTPRLTPAARWRLWLGVAGIGAVDALRKVSVAEVLPADAEPVVVLIGYEQVFGPLGTLTQQGFEVAAVSG